MRFRRFGDRYIVRLESGEPIIDTLTEFLCSERVEFANLSAAGAVSWVRLGYWNAGTRAYEYRELDEQLEVVSFQGNSALKDGAPFLHLHEVFGRRDFSAVAGHIKEARVHPTLEVWLRTEDAPVRRAPDPATGLDLPELRDSNALSLWVDSGMTALCSPFHETLRSNLTLGRSWDSPHAAFDRSRSARSRKVTNA